MHILPCPNGRALKVVVVDASPAAMSVVAARNASVRKGLTTVVGDTSAEPFPKLPAPDVLFDLVVDKVGQVADARWSWLTNIPTLRQNSAGAPLVQPLLQWFGPGIWYALMLVMVGLGEDVLLRRAMRGLPGKGTPLGR